jgi:uncharacterized protein
MPSYSSRSPHPSSRIAIIGGGAAGMAAAYLLQSTHAVSLFESSDQLGGHVRTVTIESGPDAGLPLDLGFMVYNETHYPLFCQWLQELGPFESAPSEMSFSYHEPDSDFHYALNFGMSRRESTRTSIPRDHEPPPANLRGMLNDIFRFTRKARLDYREGRLESLTLGEYLEESYCSPKFAEAYVIPMASCLWSTPPQDVKAFSAQAVIGFYENHGILSFNSNMDWQAIRGGSHRYVAAFQDQFSGTLRLNCPVRHVERRATGRGVSVTHGAPAVTEVFDRVILATHADESLALLANPTETERDLLDQWHYSRSQGVLHTDTSVLPPERSQAAWNFRLESGSSNHFSMTYDLNRLQPLGKTERRYLFSLEREGHIDEKSVIAEVPFTHPSYPLKASQHQETLRKHNRTSSVMVCGSYLGAGFHEDAVRSGFEAALSAGAQLPQTWTAWDS